MFFLNIWVPQKCNPIFKEGKDFYCFKGLSVMCILPFSEMFTKLVKSLSRHRMQSFIIWLIPPLPAVNCPHSAVRVSDQAVWNKCSLLPQGFGRGKKTLNVDVQSREHTICELFGVQSLTNQNSASLCWSSKNHRTQVMFVGFMWFLMLILLMFYSKCGE